MELVDIITYETEKPIKTLEYLNGKNIHFIREPIVGLKVMFSCEDRKVFRTEEVTKINNGYNYIIIETSKHETYIFVEGEEDGKN